MCESRSSHFHFVQAVGEPALQPGHGCEHEGCTSVSKACMHCDEGRMRRRTAGCVFSFLPLHPCPTSACPSSACPSSACPSSACHTLLISVPFTAPVIVGRFTPCTVPCPTPPCAAAPLPAQHRQRDSRRRSIQTGSRCTREREEPAEVWTDCLDFLWRMIFV